MTIKIPNNLEEMTLGQLVALSYFPELADEKEDFTDEDRDRYEYVVSTICGISQSQCTRLSNRTQKAIAQEILKLFGVVLPSYAAVTRVKGGVNYFECIDISAEELNALRIESQSRSLKGISAKWKLSRVKPKGFYIGDLHQEPAQIWQKLLDGTKRRLQKLGETDYHKEWREIPQVLASICWKKNESRTYYDKLTNKQRVDFARIEKYKEIFLNMPAITAIKLFAFFLNTNKSFLIRKSSTSYSHKKPTQILSPATSEKDIQENGGG